MELIKLCGIRVGLFSSRPKRVTRRPQFSMTVSNFGGLYLVKYKTIHFVPNYLQLPLIIDTDCMK